mmetsp:Transcript_14695/g.47891  ORF Transcript_14695/g.47891 Transcript_14695/m.47891 type:complete len:242 (-) Transcript_14695:77-802(-)
MDEGHVGLEGVVQEVAAKVAQDLLRRQLALVRHGVRAQRRNIGHAQFFDIIFGGLLEEFELRSALDAVELALELGLVPGGGLSEENLLVARLRPQRRGPQSRVVRRHRSPAKNLDTPSFRHSFHRRLGLRRQGIVVRQHGHAHGVVAVRRQRDAQARLDGLAHERVRHPHEHPSAVPRLGVAPAPAAVRHAHEHLVTVEHRLPRLLLVQVCYQTHAAGVPLLPRVVQRPWRRQRPQLLLLP